MYAVDRQLLNRLYHAAPVGTAVDWRAVLWPNHDTVGIRTLLLAGLLATDGRIHTVWVTPAGAAAVRAWRVAAWRARQAQARARAAHHGLLLGE